MTGLVGGGDDLISVKDFRSRAQVRVIVERCLYSGFIAIKIELKAFMTMPGQRHASDHDAHAFITAHRVYCDSRPCPHFRQLLVDRKSTRLNPRHKIESST